MTLRSIDLQSGSDLDSIRNSCDVSNKICKLAVFELEDCICCTCVSSQVRSGRGEEGAAVARVGRGRLVQGEGGNLHFEMIVKVTRSL